LVDYEHKSYVTSALCGLMGLSFVKESIRVQVIIMLKGLGRGLGVRWRNCCR